MLPERLAAANSTFTTVMAILAVTVLSLTVWQARAALTNVTTSPIVPKIAMPTCGNHVCEDQLGELAKTCPEDCAVAPVAPDGTVVTDATSAGTVITTTKDECGDVICQASETAESCPRDCSDKAFCGDAVCSFNEGETSATCPIDCASAAADPFICGDARCDASRGETRAICPADCLCGDGACSAALNESYTTCPSDCPKPAITVCNENGTCDGAAGETTQLCPKECPVPVVVTPIVVTPVVPTACGNGLCDGTESTASCPTDCPKATATESYVCGDRVCSADRGESSANCERDCPKATVDVVVPVVCVDSDNGRTPRTKGKVTYGSKTNPDICLSAARLQEAYCDNNSPTVVTMDCASGLTCRDGACVTAPVTAKPTTTPATVSPTPAVVPTKPAPAIVTAPTPVPTPTPASTPVLTPKPTAPPAAPPVTAAVVDVPLICEGTRDSACSVDVKERLAAPITEAATRLDNLSELIEADAKKAGLTVLPASSAVVVTEAGAVVAVSPVVVIQDADADGLPDEMERRLNVDTLEAAQALPSLAGIDKAIVDGKALGQPRAEGKTDAGLSVTSIENTATSQDAPIRNVLLRGHGTPGEVVTIYVYSDVPLVMTTTVDENGQWQLTIDGNLSEGTHEVYVAVNDDTGRVVRRSEPLAFIVQAAQAVTTDDVPAATTAAALPDVNVADASAPEKDLELFIVGGILLLIVAGLTLAVALLARRRPQ